MAEKRTLSVKWSEGETSLHWQGHCAGGRERETKGNSGVSLLVLTRYEAVHMMRHFDHSNDDVDHF